MNEENGNDVYWARPQTRDVEALAVRLYLALAGWGVSPPRRPGSEQDRIWGRLLTLAAAERRDVATMEYGPCGKPEGEAT